jgi:alpha-beta hydrolase superfamily lysophospholipase
LIGTRFPGFEIVPRGAKAGLIIVHGIAEHGARYRHAAEALAQRTIASFVYDQRGHGKNLATRAHIDDFADFAADLRLIGENVRQRFPELPLFVWGHSMGSVVVLQAAEHLAWARGLIVTGCALDALPKRSSITGAVLRIAAALVPRLRISLRIDGSALTQVLEEQRRHMSDPLVQRSASLRLLYGFAQACHSCRANASKTSLALLAIHGEADKVCPISGSRTLIEALGSPDKRLVTYPNLLHEVHNEDEASRVALFDLMSRWILERA